MKRVCVFGLDYVQDIWLHTSWVVFETKQMKRVGVDVFLHSLGTVLDFQQKSCHLFFLSSLPSLIVFGLFSNNVCTLKRNEIL